MVSVLHIVSTVELIEMKFTDAVGRLRCGHCQSEQHTLLAETSKCRLYLCLLSDKTMTAV